MTSISWWRSWHGAPTDLKWAAVAARAGVKAGVVSAVAWALLDYASQHNERGSIDGFDAETYAIYSGFDETEVIAVIKAMTDKGMIVDGRFVNWEKRQPKREDDSSGRVRKWREVKRNVTHGNAPDKDKDKDKDKENTNTDAPPPPSLSDLETATAYSNLQDHTRQAALRLYQQVTTHPQPISKHLDEVARDMEMVLDYYGDDTAHAIQDGKRVFGRWCQTVGKNGKKYSPFTPGWISWWLEELAPRPAGGEVDTSKMTTEEYMQYLYSLEEAK